MKKIIASIITVLLVCSNVCADIDNPQNDGSQKTQIVDGSGNVIGATSNALDVNIKSGTVSVDTTGLATSALQTTLNGYVDGVEGLLTTIDSDTSVLAGTDFMLGTDFSGVFGTGSLLTTTQADDIANTTDGVNTSSFLYGFDGSTWDRLKGDSTNGLLVNLGSNNDVTVTGTVTADLGATDNAVLDSIDAAVNGTLTVGSHAVTNAGTFAVQAAQSGTWTVQPGNTANTTAWKVDGSAVTQPVSGTFWQATQPVSLASVPSHDVTNAGTFAVQESGASLTALQLIDDGVYTDDTSTHSTGSSKGYGIMATAAPTDTAVNANDIGMVGMTTNRSLYSEAYQGGSAVGSGNPLQVTVANTGANATAIKVNVASGGIASGAIASGAIASGAVASGAIASGALASGSIAVGAIAAGATSIATTEDTASANADHLVKMAVVRLDTPVSGANASGSGDYIPAITDSFGKLWGTGTYAEDLAHVDQEALTGVGERRIDTLATSAGTSGDWATSNQSAEGAQWTTLSPTTTSGLSVANMTSGDTFTALTNTAQAIKASAGNLYGYYIYNPNSSAVYVNLYNIAAASVTVGTSTPLMNLAIPASSGANLMFAYPITFSNAGWSASCTTTGGGNTAPSTACEAMFFYK